MKHIKVSPAAAAIPQPCKSPYEVARDAAMRAGHDETFRQLHGAVAHDPASCWWCIKTNAGVVICPHGKVEVYCGVCDQDARDELKRNPPGDNAIYAPDGYYSIRSKS